MDDLTKRWRRRAITTWIALAVMAMLGLAALFVAAATDDTDNIAISRNAVVRAADGGRRWEGTVWNHSDSLYTDLHLIVLFLDRDGRPIGQAVGGAKRLEPGEVFHLAAPLPADAANMRVYRLRWRREGGPLAELGPYRVWPFGYVTDTRCGSARTAVGSCVEQHERRAVSGTSPGSPRPRP